MSDEEKDLFGEEEGQEQQLDQNNDNEQNDHTQNSDNNNDDDDIFGDDVDDDNDNDVDSNNAYSDIKLGPQDINESVGQQLIEVSVPRYPTSHNELKENYISRVPPFLDFEPHPFEAEKFLSDVTKDVENATDEELLQVKLQRENTIRWKYSRDSKGRIVKESNARFVEWDDGSLSMQVGSEMFDIQVKPQENMFLTIAHPVSALLQSTSLIQKNLTIIPTSTSSQVHKQITEQLAKKQLKGANVAGSLATTQDPETVKRLAEKAEEAKLKERKRLEAKRRLQEEREGGGGKGGGGFARGSFRDDDEDAMASGIGGRGAGVGEDYESDDFVVDDEDEEEGGGEEEEDDDEKAERLNKLKRTGAESYDKKERQRDEDEEEEEEEISDVEEEEDTVKKATKDRDEGGQRKKRRVIDDEDDE